MFFLELKCLAFQFYQKRGHLLGSWLYFNMYIKGPDYRKNGLRSTKRKGTAWECFFLCFLHLQWINLFFAVSPLHGLSFLQNTTPQKEQTQTNKKTQKFHQKRAPTQETKKQRNKTNCTPKTGEDAENWVSVMFFVSVCFFWFIVFLVPCFFWRAGRTKKVAGPNLLLLLPA